MFRRLAFTLIVSIPFFGTCQDSAVYSIGADIQYHPQDFFFQLRGQRIRKNLSHEVFFGFGITNTILQGQFRPKAGYDLSYRLQLADWFSVSPLVRVSYSLLNTKVPEKHAFIHTTEAFAGCRLAAGRKNRIAFAAGIGPAIEWKYDAYEARQNRFFMWNYFAEISYSHEW